MRISNNNNQINSSSCFGASPLSFEELEFRSLSLENSLEKIVQGDLSIDKTILLERFPAFRQLVEKLRELGTTYDGDISNWMHLFYVLAGLKPVLVMECIDEEDELTRSEILRLTPAFSSLTYATDSASRLYIANERPLDLFDPRKFISVGPNLLEATISLFPQAANFNHLADQPLSYLLGYGPTWEVYAGVNGCFLKEDAIPSLFFDEHYMQLGQALYKREERNRLVSREEAIARGKAFATKENLRSLTWPSPFIDLPERVEIGRVYMQCWVDEISYQTDYIQKAVLYRKRLLEFFDIPKYPI